MNHGLLLLDFSGTISYCLTMVCKTIFIIVVLLSLRPTATFAVEVAPRISDREIIESLANIRGDIKELRAGQNALSDKMDQRFGVVNQRVDNMKQGIDQRFDAVNQRFDDMQQGMNQRFDAVNQRFDIMEKRFVFFQNLMLVLIAGVFGLIGYIVWDRRTVFRPFEERLIKLEVELQRDLDLQHQDGSLLTRLVAALREHSKNDPKLQAILRSFSLL